MFELTTRAELLQQHHPTSLKPLVLIFGDPFVIGPQSNILHSLKTGESAFEYTFNKSAFDYMKENGAARELFHRYFTATSKLNCPVLADSYPFSEFHKIIDIGGGHGSLMAHILRQHPSVTGILFDLPEVVDGPNEIDSKIAQRCEVVGGDFFKEVPKGCDIYIMQQVIHDWNDDQAIKILKNCRDAMNDNGRLLVIDAVLAPGNKRDINKFIDLNMLVGMPGGRERTEPEFRELFEKAGLEIIKIIPTNTILSFSIVEGKKVKI
jgi:SAM-dependent methyltransferase